MMYPPQEDGSESGSPIPVSDTESVRCSGPGPVVTASPSDSQQTLTLGEHLDGQESQPVRPLHVHASESD